MRVLGLQTSHLLLIRTNLGYGTVLTAACAHPGCSATDCYYYYYYKLNVMIYTVNLKLHYNIFYSEFSITSSWFTFSLTITLVWVRLRNFNKNIERLGPASNGNDMRRVYSELTVYCDVSGLRSATGMELLRSMFLASGSDTAAGTSAVMRLAFIWDAITASYADPKPSNGARVVITLSSRSESPMFKSQRKIF
jgi:hypothetical protein